MAKIIERLEQKQCELAQPKEKAYLLNDGAGLYLTIQPNGKKLFNLLRADFLPFFKAGKSVRYKKSDVLAWIERNMVRG